MLYSTRQSRASLAAACAMALLASTALVPVQAQDRRTPDDPDLLNGLAASGGGGASGDAADRSTSDLAQTTSFGLRGSRDTATERAGTRGNALAVNSLAGDARQQVVPGVEPDPLTGAPLPQPVLAEDEEDDEDEDTLRSELDPYAPLGFRIGSFLLYPQIATGIDYTDNVFLTDTDRKSDRDFFYEPKLTFNSTWSRHELSGEIGGRRSYHDRYTSEDDREFIAILRGRLDIAERTNIEGELEHSVEQESRDDFGFPIGAVDRADITTDSAALEGSHTFNRVTVTLRGSVSQEDYGEIQFIDGQTESGGSRDNTIHAMGSRTSYEFQAGVAAFVDWEINDRRFAQKVASDGLLNGSSGYQLQAGLAFELTDHLTGEASAGFARQTPDDPGREVIQGFILNADLDWQITPLTTINFNAASEIDATSIDVSGSFSREYGIGIEHALRRNILLGAALTYSTETDFDTDDTSRDWTTSLSAEYLLNRWAGIKAEYAHTKSIGEIAEDGYTENEVTLGVTLRH